MKERERLAYKLKHGIESSDDDSEKVQQGNDDADNTSQHQMEQHNQKDVEAYKLNNHHETNGLYLDTTNIDDVDAIEKDDLISLRDELEDPEDFTDDDDENLSVRDSESDVSSVKGSVTSFTLHRRKDKGYQSKREKIDKDNNIISESLKSSENLEDQNLESHDDSGDFESMDDVEDNMGIYICREATRSNHSRNKVNEGMTSQKYLEGLPKAFIESIARLTLVNFIDPTSIGFDLHQRRDSPPSSKSKRKAWNRVKPKPRLNNLHIYEKFNQVFLKKDSVLTSVPCRNPQTNEITLG